MQATYFAYGSNLLMSRMQGRVPSARACGPARLRAHRLTTDKRGRDGTGKANLRHAPGQFVWGVLWSLDSEDWARLDAAEGDYRRIAVCVENAAGERVQTQTYRSDRLTEDPALAPAYKRCIVDGAREHDLPEAWVRLLEALPERRCDTPTS